MNKLKYIFGLLLLFCFIGLSAQEVQEQDSAIIKRDVTIKKAYDPVIQDSKKINVLPSVVEPELPEIDVKYSNYSTVLDPPYEIRPLESARIKMPSLVDHKDGFLRLGMGNYWGTMADLLCPIVNNSTYRWDLNMNHLGTFADKMHHENLLGMSVRRFYESGQFVIGGNYGYEGFNYYGDNKLDKNAQYFNGVNNFQGGDYFYDNAGVNTWDFAIGYDAIPTAEKERSYSLKFKYDGFAPNVGLIEHVFNTSFKYDTKMDENNTGLNVDMQNLVYSSSDTINPFNQDSYTIFRLNPYYDFNQDTWFLHVGAKINFSGQGQSFVPAADVKAQATLIEDAMYMYAGIGGDVDANTMKEILAYNTYIDLNEKIANSYTPFNLYGGLKLKLLYNFITDVSFAYKKIYDQYFFVNDTLYNYTTNTTVLNNVFSADYSDASVFNTSVKLNYNFNQKLGFQFIWKNSVWNVDEGEAWYMPKNEFDFGIDMYLTRRMAINLYSYFAAGRQARALDGSIVDLKTIADVNLGFFYAHSSKVSAFLKLNNIAHQKYEKWYGYEVNGFNAMFGLVFAF